MLLDHAQPDEQPPRQNKGSAPKGSRNALRHGLRCGFLPRGCRRIESDANELAGAVEDAVVAARGAISVTDAATISRATKWETHGRLATRWLTKRSDELTPDQLLRFSNQTVRAATERDKAVADLELSDRRLQSLWGYHNAPEGQADA